MTLEESLDYCNKTDCSKCIVKLYNLDFRNNSELLCYENLFQVDNTTNNKKIVKSLRRKKGNGTNKNRKNS